MATLVIGIGKPKPGDMPSGPGDDQGPDDSSGAGMQLVDDVRQLPPDDLAKLFAGISPDAMEVMEKVPSLAPLADFLENGGKGDDQSAAPAPGPGDLRGQIGAAMQKSMPAQGVA